MEKCIINKKSVEFADGRVETHAIVRPSFSDSFDAQLSAIRAAIDAFELPPLMVRYFVSDAANQPFPFCGAYPESVIQQPPLSGEKVAAWVWLRSDANPQFAPDGFWSQSDGSATMLIRTGGKGGADVQFESMDSDLRARGGSLADSCMRTWLFVRDIDRNYAQVVRQRNSAFKVAGMDAAGHYIASTGIQGASANPPDTVIMDSISYLGISSDNISYLKASDFMNPTMEYGVAFERATALDLPGRRAVFVSGTASINNRGEVEHVGDIEGQTERMLRNVEALLAEAGCSMANVMHMLVYLRDMADAPIVERLFADKLPGVPRIILLAPVCRPQWLIEVECMAVK